MAHHYEDKEKVSLMKEILSILLITKKKQQQRIKMLDQKTKMY